MHPVRQRLWLLVAAMGVSLGCGDGDDGPDGGPSGDACAGESRAGPLSGATWQWQLSGDVDTSIDVEVYDVDLFDVPDEVIDTLHAEGRVVLCYFSAGSWESWRTDADAFPAEALGNPLQGWEDERWLDVRSPGVETVLLSRLDRAVERGCDGVEPDNVDGYQNDSGFDLDAADQLDFNERIARAAHARALSVGLKNDLDQVEALEPCFDWALNEECFAYSECNLLRPFLDAGKAVFHVEYVDDPAEGPTLADRVCGSEEVRGFSTLVKEWGLGAWRIAC